MKTYRIILSIALALGGLLALSSASNAQDQKAGQEGKKGRQNIEQRLNTMAEELKLTAEQGSADYTLRVAIPERITFAPAGVSATVTGRVEIYGSMWYLVGAGGGQEMTIKLDVASDNILPTIYGVDGTVLKRYVDGQKAWTGTLPSTQDYFILISSYGDAGNFGLTVTIPSLGRQEIAPDKLCAGCVLPPA